jgi:hypothetical protein
MPTRGGWYGNWLKNFTATGGYRHDATDDTNSSRRPHSHLHGEGRTLSDSGYTRSTP